ncbi:MAG: hypothetical protein ABW194_11245, partial [Novosphingobium sp.]
GSRRTLRRLLGLWIALAAAFFLWEVLVFRGLFADGAAWQFDRLGEFWPTLTYVALAALPALPALVAGIVWYRRDHRTEAELAEPARRALVLRRARRVARRLEWTGLILTIVALGSLLYGLLMPRGRTEPVSVPVSIAGGFPGEGATLLTNALRGRGVSHHTQRLFFRYRTIRFAVVPLRDRRGELVPRFFVELAPEEPNWPSRGPASPADRSGYLVRNGLPGPLDQMYRQRGYKLTEPYYVLYREKAPIQYRFELAAFQIGLLALVSMLVGWRQRRHLRWLEEQDDAYYADLRSATAVKA